MVTPLQRKREAVRMQAADLFDQGASASSAAKQLNVDAAAARRWWQAWQRGGKAALRIKPYPGRSSRLTADQQQQLVKLLVAGPGAAGFETPQWTSANAAQLIEQQFGVKYHTVHVGRLLRALGFASRKRS